MNQKVQTLIQNLKHLPGVYLMHNKDDIIIYVGKAKDLQKRVSQYFLRPQVGKVARMVSEVDYFETIITANEKEAFVLEMNLIQTHYPKYNILLKDNSHYPYIAIKKKGDPYLVIKRNNKDNNYVYFGPFPHSGAAYQTIDLLNSIFPIRKCTNLQSSTCLYYHLHQCLAPCVNKIDSEVFDNLREEIISFLKGNNSKQYHEIEEKMKKASDQLDFERANEYKKLLKAIEHINIEQNVEKFDKKDRDIFAFSSRQGYLSLTIFLLRRGLLLGKDTFTVEQFNDEESQISDLILQYYQNHPLPKEIIINSQNIIDELKDYLDVDITSVTKGPLYELMTSAKENATNALDEYFLSARLDSNKLELLEELASILSIPTPYHIELFDNSHIQGSSPVGAMVAFINGEPCKKLYRKFLIEHEEARDDIASMKEVVRRHYTRLKEENKKLPDLILTDGGLNQVIAVSETLKDVRVDIPVAGLYKNDKHQTKGLVDLNGNTHQIENKKLFFLLTRMQDEVHRFAISFHQQKRSKAMTVSLFDGVEGLGHKRQEIIKRAFPDISLLRNASLEEFKQLLPDKVALALYDKIHK